jgi:H+/Cl- antiporter ClcA
MTLGKLLAAIGVILVIVGLIVSYAPWMISWFGKLPGDIRIENEHRFVFIPITSMLIVSIILTLIVNLFFRKQ